MQPNTQHPYPAGLAGYVSRHRFRLMMLLCAVALAIMLAVIYGTVGFGPIGAVPVTPAAS